MKPGPVTKGDKRNKPTLKKIGQQRHVTIVIFMIYFIRFNFLSYKG